VITSAGALVDGLHTLGAKKVAIITPYMRPLTQLVADYIEHEGVEVLDAVALEIPDNHRGWPAGPRTHRPRSSKRLKTSNADVIVASACVQMPSLSSSLQKIEAASGLPVVSAASCTVFAKLQGVGSETSRPRGREHC
jgi:maleate isomerase